jgi:DNA topoisomerase-1
VVHDGDFRSLKKDDDVYSIGLDRALELLAEEKKGRKSSKVLKDLGTHPEDEKKVVLYDGKYGPYIKYGTKNISLPDDKKTKEEAEKLELAEVVKIINAAKK